MDTTCLECGEPITQPLTGRRRLYCSGRCRQQASRRARSTFEPVGSAQGILPPVAHPDDQVAVAILESRNLAGAFLRLGREARPQLAWRCESVGTAIAEALHRYFEEIG